MKTNLSPERPIPKSLNILRRFVRTLRYGRIKILLGRKLVTGRNVNFGRQVQLRVPDFIQVGNNINIGSWFIAETNVIMGDDILISSKVSFIGNDHLFNDKNKTVFYTGRSEPNTITLEGDNLIGFGTIIIGNITIGKGCIVGAGSVVTKNLPPYTICAGVPAKPLRNRYPDEK